MAALAEYLDILNVMSYDYHGPWDPFTGHVAPMYISPLDQEHGDGYEYYSVNYTIHHFLAGGVPARKIALGLPIYGQGFTLSDPTQSGLYAPAPQPMSACRYTGTSGFCGFAEICVMLQDGGWTTVTDPDQHAVYSYKGDVWVGY
ncbi:putative chitinase 10 [Amphibalanus amphitrite]|uniref:chitinase n=1 Tax=Amphibalanus amphitrite TaxID=1232801 RepID=A0A6A4UYD2_AMPAM|nr:putative chitinase 10 [Amphibalanus amphitrite]